LLVRENPVIRKVAFYFGVVYLVAGVLGFVPFLGGSYNLETHKLLSLFDVNALHNPVHLVIGIAGILAAQTPGRSTQFARVIGGVLIAVGVLGMFAISILSIFASNGLLPVGGVDVLLHLGSGALLVYFGFTANGEPTTARA